MKHAKEEPPTSAAQIDVEKLVGSLPLHLTAVLISSDRDEGMLKYLLCGIRLLHSLCDLAPRHSKLEQILLDDVKVLEQLIDLVFYTLIVLGGYRQEDRTCSFVNLVHSALVPCSLYLLTGFISPQWPDLVLVFLAHPNVDLFMDAAFGSVRLVVRNCGIILLLAQSILKLNIQPSFPEDSRILAAISRLKAKVPSIKAFLILMKLLSRQNLDLAKSVASEVFDLLKTTIGIDSRLLISDRSYPMGYLQLNALRLVDILSDDSNFRSCITEAQSTGGCSSPLLGKEPADLNKKDGNSKEGTSEDSAMQDIEQYNTRAEDINQHDDLNRQDQAEDKGISNKGISGGAEDVDKDAHNVDTSGSDTSSAKGKNERY
ncbi:hypothetical protein L6164_001898 [Bauhinia variegata]|uniref:Uncharacterized protein n=1 Tax=Bauhinia variegata TaxID=167791 RepID=A0ACB9QB35_BAUVA|nr:hypothetical protein L6164_001898 [Bauhinia variegata]